jgi:hypothetical protein
MDAGTAAERFLYADGSLALCPRCNTPLFAKPVHHPPFAPHPPFDGASDGEWFLLWKNTSARGGWNAGARTGGGLPLAEGVFLI